LLPATRLEYRVLELLFLSRDRLLSRQFILDHLYGGLDAPEVKTIDVTICRLRKRLAEAGAPDLIETVWGQGFRLRDPAEGQVSA
jgi:two-component system cell cycle response regulator CtrA